MRRMTRRAGRLLHSERGANAVLLTFLLIPMMGFGALGMDVAAQHAERTQLQHGADAGAMAIAKMCGKEKSSCTTSSAATTATPFIAGNGGTPVEGAPEIEVLDVDDRIVTLAAAANFPHFFASLIDGDADPNHTTVRARATAEWGTPTGGTSIALTIAECEFNDLPPQEADATNPARTWLLINGGGKGEPCADGSPGGFGWLDGANCEATLSIDATVGGEVGVQPNPNKNGCSADVLATKLCDVLLIPLYDATSGSGTNATFSISRYAAFKLTGVKTGGANTDVYCGGAPLDPPVPEPVGNSKGIQGYFVKYVGLDEDFDLGDGGPDGGLTIVRLIG